MNLHHKIIAEILLQKQKSPLVEDYFSLIKNDFLNWIEEHPIKSGISYYHKLLEIGNTLQEVSTLPPLYKYKKIAIAGGFSAGKSEFISSLFKTKNVHLPTSIEPTTAIPTYIIHNQNNTNALYAKQLIDGNIINLSSIDENIFGKFSHQFLNEFGFNIKKIMPYLCLSTPLKYPHLCFIDMPGYNPSSTQAGITHEDSSTAFSFSNQADGIIWIIGLDSTGTTPRTDIQFLQSLNEEDEKPLYIVLNKADLRPLTQVEDIMETIVEQLEDYDIEFEGICAYSALEKKEYCHFKKTLISFLLSSSMIDMPLVNKIPNISDQVRRKILENENYDIRKTTHFNYIFRKIDKVINDIIVQAFFTSHIKKNLMPSKQQTANRSHFKRLPKNRKTQGKNTEKIILLNPLLKNLLKKVIKN